MTHSTPAARAGNLLLTLNDQAGITRIKLIPAARRASVERGGASLSLTTALLIGADDSIADLERFPTGHGDVRLYPDMAAARLFDAATGLTWAPADQRTPEGEPFSVCQRSLLKREVARMHERGLTPIAAFEIEFAVYRREGERWVLLDNDCGYGLTSFLVARTWMEEIIEAFEHAGIPLEQIHPEYGHGQYEVALGVRDPVTAADDYVLARMLISEVLQRHGLRASFSPKPELAATGNGCHIHLSAATAEGANIFAGPEGTSEFSETGGHWIGALVAELPEVVSVLASGPHSFARLQPGAFSGAYSCWGLENREAAVRYIPGVGGKRNASANIEVKVPDCTSNPYLALAAILAIGSAGMAAKTELPSALAVAPAKATAEELQRSKAQPFPGSLSEALRRLSTNATLRAALGDDAVDTFVGIRTLDAPAEALTDPEELYAKYRWQQ